MERSCDEQSDRESAVEAIVLAGGFSRRFGDREKLTAPIAGEPMLRRVVRTVEPLSRRIVVSCRRDQQAAFEAALAPDEDVDVPTAPGDAPGVSGEVPTASRNVPVTFSFDDPPDCGPLAGLATAIGAVEADATIVVGGDLPLLRTGALAALLAALGGEFGPVGRGTGIASGGDDRGEAVEDGDGTREPVDAAVPTVDGRLQPLCSVCRTRRLRSNLASIPDPRDRPVVAAFEGLSVREVPASRLPGGEASFGNVNTPADRREVASRLAGRVAPASGGGGSS
ncbi:MAG: molybdenum cofactor guanylyltransferase [Haloferacaceae archaeon]